MASTDTAQPSTTSKNLTKWSQVAQGLGQAVSAYQGFPSRQSPSGASPGAGPSGTTANPGWGAIATWIKKMAAKQKVKKTMGANDVKGIPDSSGLTSTGEGTA